MPTYRQLAQSSRRRVVRTGVLALALMATVAGGVAIGAADQGRAPASSPGLPQQAAPVVRASQQQLDAFGVLRRDVTEADAVSQRSAVQLQDTRAVAVYGMNVQLARRAATDAGAVWVAPGDGETCILVGDADAQSAVTSPDAGAVACMADADAAAGRLVASIGRFDDGSARQFVAGLVPDGAERAEARLSDGSTQALAIHDNVYAQALDGRSVESVTISGPSGQLVVTP